MIRIAFLIRSLGYGGAERQLTTLVRALDKDRFDVTVITFYPVGHFEEELRESNIRLISLHKRGRWDVLRFLWRLVGELKKLDPDVLHSYLVEPNLIAVLLKPLFRSTKVVWGILASDVDLENYDWFVRLSFRLQCFASRFADLIIANSEAGRDYHVALGFLGEKCTVIHTGINTEKFKPDRESRKRVRATWMVGDKTILVGLVGRLDPVKDHPTFLKAAMLLSQDLSDVRFVCVGPGPGNYEETLRQLADEYAIADRVIWAGAQSDMPSIYNALDVVCSSSFSEGLPIAIAEAMACGVPCVVTDVGDSALLVGDTGIVVPPNDPRALADGLADCLEMMASGQRPNPRSRIVERFTVSRLVNDTTAALLSLKQGESIRSSEKTV
jgi:glycosyltransferase involved in cell wall biosynthesis